MRRPLAIFSITAGALLLVAATVVAVITAVSVVQMHLRPDDRCAGPVGSCDYELTSEQIEELSGVDLPEGTEVLESSYQSALDWHMTATVRLPEGSPAPALDPDLVWDGSTLGPDGVARRATTMAHDGRVLVEILAFTV